MTANATDTQNTEKSTPEIKEVEAIITQHSISVNDKPLNYTATTGKMPLKNEQDEIQAQLFYVAYTLNEVEDTSKRPLMFVFNGGPGSSSVWLHLGAVGPKRVVMGEEGFMPAPPYRLEDNAYTWLDLGDLVFIDPVGTGFSRATKAEDSKKYWSLEGDLESVGEFIRLYLSRNERWTSPLFLAGESYGTTRASGLAGHLIDKGIAFNGIMLISTVMNFQTLHFDKGNDLVYPLHLPTYCATAWYHNQLDEDLQNRPLRDLLHEVEAWAETDYTLALTKGDKLSDDDWDAVVGKLVRYTGLTKRYIEGTNLRIDIMRFCKELVRDDRMSVGRLDSRFTGINADAVSEYPEFDPSYNAIVPPYTAMMNQYVRAQLGYKTDLPYEILSFNVNRGWEWEGGKYADTSERLRSAFAKNPFMEIFVAQGYYDLGTPYFATYYSLHHMGLDDDVKDNITIEEYEAGHMMYLHIPSLAKLKEDVSDFVEAILGN